MFIAITTYGKLENIFSQVMNMYSRKHTYLIHYNKRESKHNLEKLIKCFQNYPNVKVTAKYRVYWGEISIVKSMLYCMGEFLDSDHDYFIHLGAKEINLHPIEYIDNYINQHSYISINLDRKYMDWWESISPKKEEFLKKENWKIYYERRFCKLLFRY